MAFRFLPVAPLPQVDFPTISVGAGLPGASPETMASAVATPLERQFGRIAGVTQMTSSSGLGSTGITLQFDLNRNIDAAARDVQAAINAARSQLPANLPGQPTYRKVNPADAPILLLALTSDNVLTAQIYDVADSILAQKIAQVEGVGQVFVWRQLAAGGSRGGQSHAAEQLRHQPRSGAQGSAGGQLPISPKGQLADDTTGMDHRRHRSALQGQRIPAADHRRTRNGAAVRLQDVAHVRDSVEDIRNAGLVQRQARA